MFYSFYITVVVLYLTSWVATSKLPSFITPCSKNLDDYALSQCTLQEARKVQKDFAKGIPELGIEPLDPLHVGRVEISAAAIRVTQSDVVVKGTSKLEIREVVLNTAEGTGKIVVFGNLTANSNYDVSGQLLLLPLNGHGKFKIRMEDTEIAMRFKVKLIDGADGGKHYLTYDVKPSHRIGNARMRMDGLFGDDPTIGNTVNQVINENWRDVIKDFGPPSVKAVTDKTTEIINAFYAQVPYEELFSDV